MVTGCHRLDQQRPACNKCMDNGSLNILHRTQMPHGEMLWHF